jgi:hypothetical protein
MLNNKNIKTNTLTRASCGQTHLVLDVERPVAMVADLAPCLGEPVCLGRERAC